ncbi:MGDG synthase family glycosyltransferase [Thermoflavimicrobium dichotomicum]|uniref:Processive 1,2-diacylglycerol beta-glucosyltransferase n=1 Tax=Thermoflavimicrobium dichotomicum TaxID=46223 RepID=A0A1I3MF98_9BACL|nr:glycosyltransferase [Thermoflavimicrobium dichotomicum]SFI95784.1 processive 1,2-diacylglycerol beta-glucosyltransferase [Thermoflavimicrobium dichotomicum]
MERVLLLSMGFGTGHNMVAKTLEKTFESKSNVKAETLDLLHLIPGKFHPLLQSGYQGMLTKFPNFYHYLYDWTYQSRVFRYVSSEFIEKMGWTIRKKINQMFEDIQPTHIVSTHPFALLMLPPKWEGIPSVGVVTDYELHPIWFGRVPDILCVPKQLLNCDTLERLKWKTGVQIIETGIPVHPDYYKPMSQREARKRLSLESDRPVVLVMGGGMGLGPLEQLVDELNPLTDFQFVVLTGNNQELYERLKMRGYGKHIRIEPFRSDIPLWMSAANLLVTKPGGVTISEAIAKQLPMFLFEAFPGQEQANQKYLLHHRLAVETNPETIRNQIEAFFSLRLNRDLSPKQYELLMSPNAAEKIVDVTFNPKSSQVQIL